MSNHELRPKRVTIVGRDVRETLRLLPCALFRFAMTNTGAGIDIEHR